MKPLTSVENTGIEKSYQIVLRIWKDAHGGMGVKGDEGNTEISLHVALLGA